MYVQDVGIGNIIYTDNKESELFLPNKNMTSFLHITKYAVQSPIKIVLFVFAFNNTLSYNFKMYINVIYLSHISAADSR